MNFIKTSKFSVKGIDTTRYIPRASARGISAVKSKGLKDPLRTDRILVVLSEAKDLRLTPKRDLKFFGWSWRRGLIPSALIVISSVARDLLRLFFSGEF